eukprot:TRINITY_DN601_c0_g1_i1.p1 TRINITY_DN601_c0_g1~~TRINITY_DN601_c0_g1_i1.p1  ORF type:complete len:745 (+),score=211.90 TRINITY_DN601_c0_g1_i1:128-2236(+)
MLPDGAHKREEDWTVFFLWRQNVKGKFRDSMIFTGKKNKKKKKYPSVSVYTYKFDSTHPEDGWQSQSPSLMQLTLSCPMKLELNGKLVHEIKQFDGLQFKKLDENFIAIPENFESAYGFRFLTTEDANKFSSLITHMKDNTVPPEVLVEEDLPEPDPQVLQNAPQDFLYCINRIYNKKDETVTRGAVVKALAVCSRHNFVHIWQPFIVLALERYLQDQRIEVLADLYNTINAINLTPILSLNPYQKAIIRSSQQPKAIALQGVISLGAGLPSSNISIEAPLCSSPGEVGDYTIYSLYLKFGRQIMTIYNALLLEKRVMFLGYNSSSSEVCQYVLASVCMISSVLKGVIQRAFPYVNLLYTQFLEMPGYVAGVTNPVFEEHSEWWDVLCNLQTGKVIINPKIASMFPLDSHSSVDNDLMDIIEHHIQQKCTEEVIRSLFMKYTQHIVDIAFNEAVFPDEETQESQFKAHHPRTELWSATPSYRECQNEILQRPERSSIKGTDLHRHVRKLRIRKLLSKEELEHMFTTFVQNVKTEEQINEFLSYFPDNQGGLLPISAVLFHSCKELRDLASELLRKLELSSYGRNAIQAMGAYHILAHRRLCNFTAKPTAVSAVSPSGAVSVSSSVSPAVSPAVKPPIPTVRPPPLHHNATQSAQSAQSAPSPAQQQQQPQTMVRLPPGAVSIGMAPMRSPPTKPGLQNFQKL